MRSPAKFSILYKGGRGEGEKGRRGEGGKREGGKGGRGKGGKGDDFNRW